MIFLVKFCALKTIHALIQCRLPLAELEGFVFLLKIKGRTI